MGVSILLACYFFHLRKQLGNSITIIIIKRSRYQWDSLMAVKWAEAENLPVTQRM